MIGPEGRVDSKKDGLKGFKSLSIRRAWAFGRAKSIPGIEISGKENKCNEKGKVSNKEIGKYE